MQVFLSFSFAYQRQASAVAKALRALAEVEDVFLSSDTLLGGQRWLEELQKRISSADAFVFLLGDYIGNYQHLEFAEALDRKIAEDSDRAKQAAPPLPIVPVVFEGGTPVTLLRRDDSGLPFVRRLHLIIAPDAFARQGNTIRVNPQTMQMIAKGLTSTDVEKTMVLWRTLNPYRGLLAMREQDADFLFGRDEEITEFVRASSENPNRMLLALGASGVGKTSLILAGVFAALERQKLPNGQPWPKELDGSRLWPRLTMKPGLEPLRSLAGAFVRQWLDPKTPAFRKNTSEWRDLLLGGDSFEGLVTASDVAMTEIRGDAPAHYLLYVDQGEELYSSAGRNPRCDGTANETCSQMEARVFSEMLGQAARHPRVTVLMSARSDFLDQLQADRPVFEVRHQIDIEPLTPEDLAEVVRRPGELLGVKFETGLADALVASTREQSGGLPLLSDTLDVLWNEMQERADGVVRWGRTVDRWYRRREKTSWAS